MNIQVEEMHRTRYMGRDTKLPCSLWVHHSPNTFTCSPTRKFSKLRAIGIFRGFTTLAWSIINCISSPLPLLVEWGMGLKIPSFSLLLGLSGHQPPLEQDSKSFKHIGNKNLFPMPLVILFNIQRVLAMCWALCLGSSSEQGKIHYPLPHGICNLSINSSDGMIQIISTYMPSRP